MKSFLPFVTTLFLFNAAFSQAPANPDWTLFNSGDSVYLEPGALVFVDGDLVVKNEDVAQKDGIYNDGIISVSNHIYYGDIVSGNDFKNPVLKPAGFLSGYAERMISLVGGNTQYIKGYLAQPEQSFYNLAIDKSGSNAKVVLQTDVQINGSLLWSPKDSVSATFNHNLSALMNSGEYDFEEWYGDGGTGIIQTYLSSQNYEIIITNPDTLSLAGYDELKSGGNTAQKWIMNSGEQTSGVGGLSRAVHKDYTGHNYVYPIGTDAAGYNPILFNFTDLPSTTKQLRGLFKDGNVGSVNYNRHGTLTCTGQPQWFIFDEFKGQGYWSFDAQGTPGDYKYSLMAYPVAYGYGIGSDFNNKRILKNTQAIGAIPDGDWTSQVEQPEYTNDIDEILSHNTTFDNVSACFSDPILKGVPGGPYIGFSHFQMGGNSSNQLPVELISLKAFPVNNEFIRVAWTTATEINNKQFDVLRSEDGLNFFKIGEVAGNGTTTEIKNYTFDDKNVLPNITYYYRLNQIDFDGEEELSNIVSAAITGSANVIISEFVPNPTREKSRLFITSPTDIKLDVTMFNAIGQEIQSSTIELPAGVQTPFAVDGHILAAGNYFVSLKNESFFVTRKLVITAH